MELSVTFFLRLVASAWTHVVSPLWRLLKRPAISRRRAPENVLEHLKPHTSLAKAQEVLGVPIREGKGYCSYKFSDAFIQIDTEDGKSISAIWLVLPRIRRSARFRVYPLDFVLGQSTMRDACRGDTPGYVYDRSSKHFQFQTTQYFGYDGHYLHYIFGVIGTPNIEEPDVKFSSHEEGEISVVASDPSEIVPNMVCVTANSPPLSAFNFWAFH